MYKIIMQDIVAEPGVYWDGPSPCCFCKINALGHNVGPPFKNDWIHSCAVHVYFAVSIIPNITTQIIDVNSN